MRKTDIYMCSNAAANFTTGMYLPARTPAAAMSAADLKKGLCAKSRGDWHACESCPGGCAIGRRLAAIMRKKGVRP